jgi:hypothetical protein
VVEHSIGMLYLSTLLANPGHEIPAVDLAAAPGLGGLTEDRGAGSSQPVLDEVALRGYRQRLSQLAGEIERYEARDESGRAAELRTERDWLIGELAAATGLGGRPRRFTDSAERARIAVGKAIRRALDRIRLADPVLGEELRAAVQTGTRCCYRPDALAGGPVLG